MPEIANNFVEMLRSLTIVGREPNLSRAARGAGLARHTLRRHIKSLETMTGHTYLRLDGTEYSLTDAGRGAVAFAQKILGFCERFASAEANVLGGLTHASMLINEGWFHTQQHPVNRVFTEPNELLASGLGCWADSRGKLESAPMDRIRDRLVVMRPQAGQWICVDIGARSALADLLGWEKVKSVVGQPMMETAAGSTADRLLSDPLDHVLIFGGVWHDHVSARFPAATDKSQEPINYQRLIFSCSFPDGSPAIASLVHRTNDIEIAGVEVEVMT